MTSKIPEILEIRKMTTRQLKKWSQAKLLPSLMDTEGKEMPAFSFEH